MECSTNSGSLMAHMGLFLPTIMGQGSQDQQMSWLPRALEFKMIGSYAQTGERREALVGVARVTAGAQNLGTVATCAASRRWRRTTRRRRSSS